MKEEEDVENEEAPKGKSKFYFEGDTLKVAGRYI
jgi:hypothetical protein